MPRFEVFCPAAPPALALPLTLRVDAEHWLAALKAGLQKVGAPQAATSVLCDVQEDGSIHVSDPRGGGVFRIHEVHADSPARSPAGPGAAGEVARAAPPVARVAGEPVTGHFLAEVRARTSALATQDRMGGLAFLLDLAMTEVDADAGSVLLAPPGRRELEFAVVRGPRAGELLALRPAVPFGVGVVGFCAQEGVAVAVSDAARDPRFHRAISEAIGYETRSLLCAPIARAGQVLGALEVLNKRGGAAFDEQDVAVLSYLGERAAEHLARGA